MKRTNYSPANKNQDPLQKWHDKGFTKVYNFLNSIKRRSIQSMQTYGFGLEHFERFVAADYSDYNIESIFNPLTTGKLDVYKLLDQFVEYLQTNNGKLTALSIKVYLVGVRSYLQFYDIGIIPTKFKRKVKMPPINHEDEEPIDASDIRQILIACNNRRLKAYLLTLASGGMRAIEALAIRNRDINDGKGIDLNTNSTKIHIRKEYAKTRVGRDIYISNEATFHLKQYLDWKYRDRHKENYKLKNRVKDEDDLVFALRQESTDPTAIYTKVLTEFEKLLDAAGFNGRKEEGVYHRRKITFHSFRRNAKSTISNEAGHDFSEYILGHSSKSVYYTMKEPARRDLYEKKCMPHLTFLDYTLLESKGRSVDAQLERKDEEIRAMQSQLNNVQSMVQNLIQGLQNTTNQQQFQDIARSLLKAGALKVAEPKQ